MNLYTIKNTENFGIIDSPGDTENENCLAFFAKKGYAYSKMLFYVMDERKTLDTDSMKNNKNLEILIEVKLDYKIPIIILLTHSDNYCDEVKKSEINWKEICKTNIYNNKKNLLSYINNDIIKRKNKKDVQMEENDVLHIVLIEPKVETITDKEIIAGFQEGQKKLYENLDKESQKMMINMMIGMYEQGKKSNDNEVQNLLKEMNVLRPKEFIQKLKEKFPSQYHSAFK